MHFLLLNIGIVFVDWIPRPAAHSGMHGLGGREPHRPFHISQDKIYNA